MSANRKQRRATASQERKAQPSKPNGHAPVALTAPQKRRIAIAHQNCIAVERRLATLELERDAMLQLVRQKRAELQAECAGALRGHGIDVDDPRAGRWNINPDTMEVEHQPAASDD